MFDDKTITKQKVKDLIYALRNEFDNELDYDYESNYKTELTDVDYDIMNEYLNRFVDKLNLTINDELEDVKEDFNMLYSIKLPVKDGYRSIIVEAPTEYTIEDIKEGLTPDSIIDTVCKYFNITKNDIVGKKKNKEIVEPRMISIYLICELLDIPLVSIGKKFGGRDHTTIMHARDKITEQVKTNNKIKVYINDIKDLLTK